MKYSPLTEDHKKELLEEIGVSKIEDLFSGFPKGKNKIELPAALSELDLKENVRRLSEKNNTQYHYLSFLGAGSYDSFIPSVIEALTSRSEFYTAYTPYQPEISQGTLRVIFEFQTMICELTGMEVGNASLYDGASALAEACVMAAHYKKKKKVFIYSEINPKYKSVLRSYLEPKEIAIIENTNNDCCIDETLGAVVIACPDFHGDVHHYGSVIEKAKACGVAVIYLYHPISLALLKSPGELGADIAVAEGQPLGIHQAYGGPGLGLLSTKKEFIRFMPGRIVGKTEDQDGNEGYVLTFQTREQHIRRDKSLSNICSNQGLMALVATIYMGYMGPIGLRRVAELCYKKTKYLMNELKKIDGIEIVNEAVVFNEFIIKTSKQSQRLLAQLKKNRIIGGLDLSIFGNRYENQILISVTERRSQNEIDYFIEMIKKATGKNKMEMKLIL